MVLLAAGGLALAAGVLSLVQLAPESGVPGLGTAEAGPRTGQDPGHSPGSSRSGSARSAGTAVTVSPRPRTSAPEVMGGVSATPTPSGVSHATASAVVPSSTAPRPDAPSVSAAPGTTPADPPSSTAPAPTPRPSHTTRPSTPPPGQPGDPEGPGLCLPVIGICVGIGLG
ncbi:hypothetical protein C3489_35455 [Streptomyces sp. Ru71]|nr:hypothetical protein C3489_35455 [Streptomyces sp. Ru71]